MARSLCDLSQPKERLAWMLAAVLLFTSFGAPEQASLPRGRATILRRQQVGVSPRPAPQPPTPAPLWERYRHPRRSAVSACEPGCTLHGTCNEELGRCDCPRDRGGPACAARLSRLALRERCKSQGYATIRECLDPTQSCVNGCNQRGDCRAGFCHCAPGTFGSDCSLSLGPGRVPRLLDDQGYSTRAKRPWVYVYELPPSMAVWYNFKRLDRNLHIYFWQRLLGSGARIADGDQADWYFIPVRQRCAADSSVLAAAVEYIRQTHPWWNATGGARHVVLQTGDWGRAESLEGVQELTWNVTWLTHWGLTQQRPVSRWAPSFRPDKDVVIPVYVAPGHFVKFGMIRSPLHPENKRRPRNATTLFFAGRICHDARRPSPETWPHCGDDTAEWYGGGIREKVFVSHWNRTGFRVVRSEPRYGRYLATSAYCLAPPGAGHGQRQIQALFMGCVPVTVGDHIAEPFEPAVSWEEWGVRVAEADIPAMHHVLAAVTPRQLAEKQSRMHCAAQHMLYSSVTGGLFGEDGRFDAFETTLEVLRVRAAHPGARQEDFRQLDPDFASFMDCGDPPGFRRPARPPAKGGDEGDEEEAGDEEGDMEGATDREGAGGGEIEYGADAAKAQLREGKGGGSDGSSGSQGLRGGERRGGGRERVALCSHSWVDVYRPLRSCYIPLRGSGYMGVPGGALCARGHKHRLADCPRPWA